MGRSGTNRLPVSQESIGGRKASSCVDHEARFLSGKEEGHSRNDGEGEIPAERGNSEELGEEVNNGGGIWLTLHAHHKEHQASRSAQGPSTTIFILSLGNP